MESKWGIFLLTILIVSSGVEISAECYKRCHKDYIQTCNISEHKCAKTETRGYKCMPVEEIDECASNPCTNGGTCIDNYDGYSCNCPDGQGGPNCDGIIDPCENSSCQNGGTCTGNGDSYTCMCTQDYDGTNCEIAGCNAKFGTTKCFDRNYYYMYEYKVYYYRYYAYEEYLEYVHFFNYPSGKLCGCTEICLDEENCCHDSDCLNPSL